MKLALLAAANSIHTQRWCKALSDHGLAIDLLSQDDTLAGDWGANTKLVRLPFGGTAGYVRNVPTIRAHLKEHKPDIVHAHYAGGYGLSLALSRTRPAMLSVWGADVYDVPARGPLFRALTQWILRYPDRITSTSEVMRRQALTLVDRPDIDVVPFGIDLDLFCPGDALRPDTPLRIGLVKTMAPKYGVDTLIEAYALLRNRWNNISREPAPILHLVGGGSHIEQLQTFARDLGVDDSVLFEGPVEHGRVPDFLRSFDIYAAPSRLDSESFGVAILEASACGVSVIVSDAGGLPEVVADGVTGLIVPRDDPEALARALERLALDPELRARMGRAGRERVEQLYSWPKCVDRMVDIYRKVGGA